MAFLGTFAIIALLTNSAVHKNKDVLCEDEPCDEGKYSAEEIGVVITFYIGVILVRAKGGVSELPNCCYPGCRWPCGRCV